MLSLECSMSQSQAFWLSHQLYATPYKRISGEKTHSTTGRPKTISESYTHPSPTIWEFLHPEPALTGLSCSPTREMQTFISRGLVPQPPAKDLIALSAWRGLPHRVEGFCRVTIFKRNWNFMGIGTLLTLEPSQP